MKVPDVDTLTYKYENVAVFYEVDIKAVIRYFIVSRPKSDVRVTNV